MGQIRALLPLARCYKLNFNLANGLQLLDYNFDDTAVAWISAYNGVKRGGSLTQAEVLVSYWNGYAFEAVRFDFVKPVVRPFKIWSFINTGFQVTTHQRAFATVEGTKFEEVTPSADSSINKEPEDTMKLNDVIVEHETD